MATQLNNYDMVLAVSEDTINNQFYLLMAEGVIDSTIDIHYVPSNQALVLNGTVNPPTVDMVLNPASPHQLDFNLTFQSGTFTYMDYVKDPNNPQSADVTGWEITFLVNLSQMTIDSTNPTGLKLSEGAQKALAQYVGDDAFTVQTLFLDLDNVNLSSLVITAAGVKMEPTDPRYPWLLAAMQQLVASLKASGNPYILTFHASSNNPQQTNPQLPALAPTRVQFIANQYNYPGNLSVDHSSDGLSALCYLAMVGNDPFPYTDNNVPTFAWNPIPAAQVQGRMFIDANTFNSGYINDLVLPVLQQALGVPGNWAQTGNSWTLDYQWNNGNQHDGHGPVVGSDSGMLDIYGKSTTETSCTLSLDLGQSTNNAVVYSGSGFFFERLDLYEAPFGIWVEDAWTSTKLPFTFTLTISAGASATLNVAFSPTQGTPQPDSWENPVVKFTDAIAGLFNASVQSQLDAVNGSWSTFEQSEFGNFTNAAQQGFQGLSQQLILPAPQQFYYSNVALNSEYDLVLDVGFKS